MIIGILIMALVLAVVDWNTGKHLAKVRSSVFVFVGLLIGLITIWFSK